MHTTASDIGKFLEEHAKIREPITYTQVVTRFRNPEDWPIVAVALLLNLPI
jgi:hypothetical protein